VKKLVLLFLVVLVNCVLTNLKAQEKNLEISSKIDLVTRHLWRGYQSGTAPTLEPTLNLKKGKLNFTAWGAYSLDNSYQEVDLFVTYKSKYFEIALLDYYCPEPDFSNSKFFDFNSSKSVHLIDVNATLKASKKFPVSIMASVLLHGRFDQDDNKNQRYSTYIEFGHKFKINGKSMSGCFGITPFKGYYDSKANLVNVSLYLYETIKLSDWYKLPVKCGLTINPIKERLYFVFAFTLK
jgi:hypothetical protein